MVSLLSGLLAGILGLAMDLTWKQTLMFIVVAIAKDGNLYLMKHPFEQISFDTTSIRNPAIPPVEPPKQP